MNAQNRQQLVEEIMEAILAQMREAFPLAKVIDYEVIARECGVPFSLSVNSAGRQEKVGDEVFGESFSDLVRSSGLWLAAQGLLIERDGPSYTLSANGAKLMQCRPAFFSALD